MKIMFQTYYRAPVAPQINREQFRATLPAEFQHLVPTETVAKRALRLVTALPSCLDEALAQVGMGARRGGHQQWSIIAVPSSLVDKSLGHAKAYSIRLTQSGAIVGDYERESTPVGDVFFTDEGKVQARGDFHIIEGVRLAAARTQDLLATKDLLSIFRAGMYHLGGFEQGKTSWYVSQHKVEDIDGSTVSHDVRVPLTAFIDAFKNIGARVGMTTVAVEVGDNVEDIARSFHDYAKKLIHSELTVIADAKVEQAKYARNERQRSLRTSTFAMSQERMQDVIRRAESLSDILDTENFVLTTMVQKLRSDAEAICNASQDIESKITDDKNSDWSDSITLDVDMSDYASNEETNSEVADDPCFEGVFDDKAKETPEDNPENADQKVSDLFDKLFD